MESTTIDEVTRFLNRDSLRRGIDAEVVSEAIRSVDDWLYIPIRISSTSDALEKATFLQDLEDGWNTAEPEHLVKILLVPAKNEKTPSV